MESKQPNRANPETAAGELRFHPDHAETRGGAALHTERLYEMLGRERDQEEVARSLRYYVQSLQAPVVGGFLVNCSDEAELECVEAFRRSFVHYLLPTSTFFSRSAFHTANLGARYEWSAVKIAEEHFADACSGADWKVLVGKLNGHVAVEEDSGGPRFGSRDRYRGQASNYCGALHALLDGDQGPFIDALRESLDLEGRDLVAELLDGERVAPEHRQLFAAVLSARQQARCAMIDLQDHQPAQPTLYLLFASVSLNRGGRDTEIPVGLYTADRRGEQPHDEYCGLGDRPADYRLERDGHQLVIRDPHSGRPRRARLHRELVLESWRRGKRPDPVEEPRLQAALAELRAAAAPSAKRVALTTLLALLFELSPIPAAVLLFGGGALGVHHVARAHRLAREAAGDEVARGMLGELRGRVEDLPPEQAQHLVDLLVAEYGR